MAAKTYFVTQNVIDYTRKLDDFTLPWVDIDSATGTSNFNDVMTSPDNINYVTKVGGGGNILVSNDAGATWTLAAGTAVPALAPAGFWEEVWIVDNLVGYAIATDGSTAKTIDGGVTWDLTTTFPTDTGTAGVSVGILRQAIHFIDTLIGVASFEGKIRKTTDGGVTWSDLNGGSAIFLNAKVNGIHLSADEQTIVVSTGGFVYQSTDAGLSFSVVYTHPAYGAFDQGMRHLAWINDNELWYMGMENSLVKSNDGGATWIVIQAYTPASDGFMSGHMYDANNGYFGRLPFGADDGYVDVTSDAAATFSLSYSLTSPNSLAFYPTSIWTTSVICEGFTVDPCPIIIPTTPIGETTTVDIDIRNDSSLAENIAFTLGACSASVTILTLSPLALAPGASGIITVQYSPTVLEDASCDITFSNSCENQICAVEFESVNIPECSHFNICITGPACAPDCIEPGSVIQFDLGGTISLIAYPTIVTFSVINNITGEIIFSQEYPVANDSELDAIVINVVAPGPGAYSAEVCLPGCNSKRILTFDVCEPFDIYKDDCMKWHVFRPTECQECTTNTYIVCLRELEGDTIIEDILWDIDQDNTFEFELPGDGIYIFEMKDPDTLEVLYSFTAWETCQLQECFKIMMDKIMCSCADPCCKKCNGVPQEQMDFARGSLNKLVPLYLTYLGMARRNELHSVGLKWITDDQLCYLHDANATLGKILEIIEDCDCLCPEQKSTASSRGDCLSC